MQSKFRRLSVNISDLCTSSMQSFRKILAFNSMIRAMGMTSLAMIISHCAHPVLPTGGLKDIVPPEALAATPENYSTGFSSSRAVLTFDEYIQLKEPSKEIFISPPIKLRPDFKVKGKSLVIEFQEPLRENATYTIYFGNAIVDLTEGNPLRNFEYVFSTGPVIDSLSVSGKVYQAFDLKPAADVLAMVYLDNNDTLPFDSLPLRVPPVNVSRASKEGEFHINNLPAGQYKLFILEDLNNNFYHDLAAERIGFIKETIMPAEKKVGRNITEPGDTTLLPDSLLVIEESLKVYLFEGPDSVQRLLGKHLTGREKITYVFRMPLDTAEISLVNFPDTIPWHVRELNSGKDSLTLWLRREIPDTLSIRLETGGLPADTSRFVLREESSPGPRRKASGQDRLTVNSTSVPQKDLNRDFILVFSAPLTRFSTEKLVLATPEDTLSPPTEFLDLLHRKVRVDHAWKPGMNYVLTIPDSCAWSIGEKTNQRRELVFSTKSMEDYGVLVMNYIFPEGGGQYIVQLVGDKETVLRSDLLPVPGKITYDYIRPGKYKIKAIADVNHNGRWDTGNYRLQRLPEPVYYFPLEIAVRANWELQEEWTLEAPAAY